MNNYERWETVGTDLHFDGTLYATCYTVGGAQGLLTAICERQEFKEALAASEAARVAAQDQAGEMQRMANAQEQRAIQRSEERDEALSRARVAEDWVEVSRKVGAETALALKKAEADRDRAVKERDEWKAEAEKAEAVSATAPSPSAPDAQSSRECGVCQRPSSVGCEAYCPGDVLDDDPAPSPSARAEEPVAWRVMRGVAMTYTARTKQEAERMSAFTPGSRVEPLYAAPPDLTAVTSASAEYGKAILESLHPPAVALRAEIAKLKERERALSVDGSEYQQEAEALREEVAKLKAERDNERAGREQAATGWLARNDDPDSTCLWFPTKEAARKQLAMWRNSRSRCRFWLVRLTLRTKAGAR